MQLQAAICEVPERGSADSDLFYKEVDGDPCELACVAQ